MTRASGTTFERVYAVERDYIMDHTSRTYLIDRDGKARSPSTQDDSPEVIAGAMAQLL